VAAACEVLVSVVVNAAQTEQVLFGDDGAAPAHEARQPVRDVLDGRSELVGGARRSPGRALAAVPGRADLRRRRQGRQRPDDDDDRRQPEAYAKADGLLEAMAAKVYRLGDRPATAAR
jgi:putative dehydrogenase